MSTSHAHLCVGGIYGSGVAGKGTRGPLLTTRGQRTGSDKDYRTLPSQRHQYTQPLNPVTTHCADPRRFAADTDCDCDAAGNCYSGRSSSVADGGSCDRRRRLLSAVSDVDLTSHCDLCESGTWKHRPSIADLSSTASGLDMRTDVFRDLLRSGCSLQELPDTHL